MLRIFMGMFSIFLHQGIKVSVYTQMSFCSFFMKDKIIKAVIVCIITVTMNITELLYICETYTFLKKGGYIKSCFYSICDFNIRDQMFEWD